MSSQLCSVCRNPTFKYRCPSCRATSCSLQCFKAHKQDCNSAGSGLNVVAPSLKEVPAGSVEADSVPLDDLLIHDPRVGKLFEQFPNLRVKLKTIYETAVTTDQETLSQPQGPAGHRSQRSPEQRLAQAMRMLDYSLKSDSADVSGMTAFAALVAELSSKAQHTTAMRDS